MRNRTLAIAPLLVLLTLIVLSGSPKAVDAQSQAPVVQCGEVRFVVSSGYVINVGMIRYIEKLKNGGLRVHITGQRETVVGVGEDEAKAFVGNLTQKVR